jgi:hypothetical protein
MRKGMIVDVRRRRWPWRARWRQAEQTSGYDLSQAIISMAGSTSAPPTTRAWWPLARNEQRQRRGRRRHRPRPGDGPGHPHPPQPANRPPDPAPATPSTTRRRSPTRWGCTATGWKWRRTSSPRPRRPCKTCTTCADNVGISAEEFVLNALASGEAVLEPAEREMGVSSPTSAAARPTWPSTCRARSGTPRSFPIGGYHITNDIAIGLRAPYDVAEQVKIQYGDCRPDGD